MSVRPASVRPMSVRDVFLTAAAFVCAAWPFVAESVISVIVLSSVPALQALVCLGKRLAHPDPCGTSCEILAEPCGFPHGSHLVSYRPESGRPPVARGNSRRGQYVTPIQPVL